MQNKLPMILLATLFFIFGTFTSSATAGQAPLPSVNWNGESLTDVQPVVKDGRIYLPLRKLADLLQCVTTWDSKSGEITINRPETSIQLQLGSDTAQKNGRDISFDAPPFVRQGVTYVPLRFTADSFGIDIAWNSKSYIVEIRSESSFAFATADSRAFWLDPRSGNVYVRTGDGLVTTAGKTNFRWEGEATLYSDATRIDERTYLLYVRQFAGTTLSMHNDYQLLIHDNAVVKATASMYKGGISGVHQQVLDSKVIMTDGALVEFVNADGSTASDFNLAELTGLKNNTYIVEVAFDDAFLARSSPNGTLWLVNRNTRKATALYQLLLTPEQKQRIDDWDKTDAMYQGDGLAFAKRDGRMFTFTHREWWSGGTETKFDYSI